MVSVSRRLAKSMVLRMLSRVSPGSPMMKSPWIDQAELLAVGGEALRHVDGGALLDVLEDLLVARFVAHDQQAAAGFLHGLERVVIGGDARGAGPGEVERLELLAELDGALLAVVEGIVVEEDFLDLRELLERVADFVGDVVGGAQAPAVAGVRLRPQAEGAHRRAAARGVERNERVEQERNVVARDVEIALVDLGDPGQRVQIFDGGAFGIVDDLAVLAEADAGQFFERLALGVVDDLMIELAAHHEIDGLGAEQGLVRLGGDGGPTKATFSFGLTSFIISAIFTST